MAHWQPQWPVEMTHLDDDFHIFTTPNPKNGRKRFCYFLKQKAGNVLFHGPDSKRFYADHGAFFEDSGGIRHHVFTHGSETSPECKIPEENWGTTNWLSTRDVPYLRKSSQGLEFRPPPLKGRWIPNLKAVPLPGHSPGFTGYLVKRPDRTYLIIGDFINPAGKGLPWRARVPHPLLHQPGLASLATVGKLKFDVFLPNQTGAPKPAPWPAEWKDEMLEAADASIHRRIKATK